jgi:hypothetical protein
MLKLTRDNYHSLEADRDYMSRSQFLNFLDCEAREVARLAGVWQEEKSEALLVGSYVHAWSEGRREEFKKTNPDMFTKAGELKANFKTADKMIAALESDPLCMYMLQGDKEVILTAELYGATWKVMLDVRNRQRRRNVDLKTTKSIREKSWSQALESRVSFVEQYKYVFQSAIYSEIERLADGRPEYDWYDMYIVAVSKECVPDKEVIDMRDPERYIRELDTVRACMPRILQVKAGEIEPIRCERCDYCRSTRKLKGAVHYTEL